MKSLSIVLVLTGLLAFPAGADETPVAALAESPSDSQQQARSLLLGMASFLAGQSAFSLKLLAGYDVVQPSGQKIEFIESRAITLERPNRLRIDERVGTGSGSSVLFDGKTMTVWDAEQGVFARVDQPGSIDDAVVYFVRDLGMRLPLAPLLITGLAGEMQRRVLEVDYVELTDAFGQPAHHVAGRTDTVDFQAWIADGDQPWPLRIVMTYDEPGQPQYWAQFSDWNPEPRIRSSTFALKLPPEARQIVFVSQVPAPTTAGQSDGAAGREAAP